VDRTSPIAAGTPGTRRERLSEGRRPGGARRPSTSGAPIVAGTLPRLLPDPPTVTIEAHLDRFGPMPVQAAGLVEEVRRAGLRGRGGAGFPTGVKMASVASRRRTVVVANGTEGEPASAKDKTLLAMAPHLVLDGAVLAALAVGAREATICVERTAASAVEAVNRAIDERTGGHGDPVKLKLALTPDRYVAGEESALVHWLNGGDAKPTFVPPRPFERGVGGRPTLIDNVETLAHVALIARYGSAWWRTVGTAEDPGSALVTLSGAVARPGVYEIPLGLSLAAMLDAAGTAPKVRAVLVGGYFGTWLPGRAISGIALGSASLRQANATFGCGALAVLPDGCCGLAEAARVTRWLAGENAGQCGPCVFGLAAIAKAMDTLVAGDRSGNAERLLARWTGMVKGRGACKHPDGAARFVESSVHTFADEIDKHRRRGPCPSTAPILPTPVTGGWR
jgi:NADH:ubiquinone oxidoreductase subunit F (NADH-binding)